MKETKVTVTFKGKREDLELVRSTAIQKDAMRILAGRSLRVSWIFKNKNKEAAIEAAMQLINLNMVERWRCEVTNIIAK